MSKNKGVINNDESQISLFASFDWDIDAKNDRGNFETGESESLSQITFSENLDNSSKIVRRRSRKSRSTNYEEPKLDLWDTRDELPRDDRKHSKNKKRSRETDNGLLSSTSSQHDFSIENEDQSLNAKQKFKNNLKAIKTLRSLEASEIQLTQDVQEILSHYTGWGGLPHLFDNQNPDWKKEREELQKYISDKEYKECMASTLTSFYTPQVVIKSMYEIVQKMGFDCGNILDPCVGTGNFIGLMPNDMRTNSNINAVEIDNISGSICKYLYPSIEVQIKGFEKTEYQNNSFDLAISNVPFGRYSVYDREFAKYNFQIHDFFFAKALSKVRQGGLLCFITSTATLDNPNNKIREWLYERADLIGAIRLPNNTFTKNGANTTITSDIIFLKKLDQLRVTVDEENSWLKTDEFQGKHINHYFTSNPHMILGTLTTRSNAFGGHELTVNPNKEFTLAEMLQRAVDHFPDDIYHEEEIFLNENETQITKLESEYQNIKDGAYFLIDRDIYRRQSSNKIKLTDYKNESRIRQLLLIENIIEKLIHIQLHNFNQIEFQNLQEQLKQSYNEFIIQYGYINSKENFRIFRNDPNFYMLMALEIIDKKTNKVSTSDIFRKRTIKPRDQIIHAESAKDAMLVSLDKFGRINIDFMQTIYNKSKEDIEAELLKEHQIYVDPKDGSLTPSNEYLSGNIREKLKIAESKNDDGRFDNNITDLKRFLPEWITADNITCQLGTTWVPAKYVSEFICHLLNIKGYQKDSVKASYSPLLGSWDIMIPKYILNMNYYDNWAVPPSENLDIKYRQPDYSIIDLMDDVINSKTIKIMNYYDVYENGKKKVKSKLNKERTIQARYKANNLDSVWQDWIYSDLNRREDLEKIYNNLYNSDVLQTYDGAYLTFPQMNPLITLEDFQKNSVAQMMFGGNTLLAQAVGAGKTFEIIATIMELKRIGLRTKPMIVVPNHLVMQWSQEFYTLYPSANILCATKKDLQKDNRNAFIHRIATNDYDAIIIAHSSFKLIPLSKDYQIDSIRNMIDDLSVAIELERESDVKNTYLIKRLESSKKSYETKIESLLDHKTDDGIVWQQLGIDLLCVDEAHYFKNLAITTRMSNIAGVSTTASQKAFDLYCKANYIKSKGGSVIMATGTPMSNSMTELYTFQRYLQEDLLQEKQIYSFDAWAKNYGKVTQTLEISVDGGSYQTKERFNKFFNIPELMQMFRKNAIIMTSNMLANEMKNSKLQRQNSTIPTRIGGKPIIIQNEPSPELKEYMEDVVERMELIHANAVDPRVDNPLKVNTDSKKASIDLRLIDEEYGCIAGTKIIGIASNVKKVYDEFAENKGVQVLFCDYSTPNNDKWNIYFELRKLLVEHGIPKEEIAFIHDYQTESEKSLLFDELNDGIKRIIIASTPKMGAGTNIQQRLCAIHHIDVPWKASDIEQRNGRGFRQGNMFDAIYEFRYVTVKSYDAYSWQIIETKSTYMQQLLEGSNTIRTMDEMDENILSYAEIKAIASGNPLIRKKMEVDNQIRQLQMKKSNFLKQKFQAEKSIIELPAKIKKLEDQIALLEEDVSMKDNSKTFSVTINDITYTDIKRAGEELQRLIQNFNLLTDNKKPFGKYRGYDMAIQKVGLELYFILIAKNDSYRPASISNLVQVNFNRFDKLISEMEDQLTTLQNQKAVQLDNQLVLEEIISSQFKDAEMLNQLLNRQKEIDLALNDPSTTVEIVNEENIEMEA
ncbi:SNF2-related protein [[Clostridium] innocuum]|uniref:SNF2-related protein n=1 Tax=Clostridium innocuum TaxID=1522 RepID=UPI001AF6A46A|nr:SNF2-related protein [[Clostridium] innocuum]MDU1018782.1 SNF2-related protein [Bifidobacterium breve]QSI26879.1 hypothetical protein GKZ87_15995 [Erysipelotrichaceae bacterium 66202529]MCC2831845.1 DEAD/DEAH box helicase family protein [[Clostridium] innocuum]MCR0248561.1 SNF2-related protein [[Clostridium] innocuum]MCR0261072.1 SNF2-related protein [[Clostridium] innocuum]